MGKTECQIVYGTLADHDALRAGLKGTDYCFHVAASYHLWMRDYAPMYAANVEGTRNILEAAWQSECKRIVYTSTVGCIGLPDYAEADTHPANETTPFKPAQLSNHYKRSKWQAEQVALSFAQKGCPVVIVNPSAPVGPRDVKPTPTGKIIVDFLNRQMPAYLETGLNWVHVRDVAIGHILAAEKGTIGERYILGNTDGNWDMKKTFAELQRLSGIPAPKWRIPYGIAYIAACLNEVYSSISGTAPKAPMAGVRMAKYKMYFNPAKAVRELGMPQTPPVQAFKEAIEWFVSEGYVKQLK